MPNIRRWNSCVASTSLERAATYQARFRYRLLADMIILFPWSPHPWRRMRGDQQAACQIAPRGPADRSEEHTSELKSLMRLSYAVFCLKKKIQRESKHYH